MKRLLYHIATLGPIGKLPASGTFGSLCAMLLFVICTLKLSVSQQLLVICLASTSGILICKVAAQYAKTQTNRTTNHDNDDPSIIVWDELCGMWLALLGAPIAQPYAVYYWLGAFVLFRVLDIRKPWYIGWCDKHLHGGLGIMADDIVAGICTLLCCQGLWKILT